MTRASRLTLPRVFALACGVAGPLAAWAVATTPLGATACGTAAAGGGTGTVDPAGAPIVIGAANPLSGSLSGNARAMQGGLLAAVAQVNALGGVLGRQVQIDAQDDMSSPSQAEMIAMQFYSAGLVELIGPSGSPEVSQIESYVQMSGIVETSATATSAQLTTGYAAKEGYFFRTVPNDGYQAVAVGLFALRGPNPDAGMGACNSMVVVHSMDSYGDPLSAAIEAYFTGNGGSMPTDGDIGVPTNALGDYTSQVNKILAATPDCLVLVLYPPAAAQLMQNLSNALSPTPPTGWSKNFFVIGTDAMYDPSLITEGRANPADPSSQSWVNGTYGPPLYGTVAYTNDQNRPQYNEFANIYMADVGLAAGQTSIDPYTANEYDAVILELLAIQAAGTPHSKPVQSAMFDVSHGKSCSAPTYGPEELADAFTALQNGQDINYQGASGNVDFTDYGDVISDFLVWTVTGSEFTNHSVVTAQTLAAAENVDAGGCQ